MINGKVWGTTEPLLVTPMIEVHRIHVKSDMVCSVHKHERKWNMFYCIDGQIKIHVKKNDYDLIDVTHLQSGEYTSVKPGEFHWFSTEGIQGAEVLEIYYLEPITEDIVRDGVGGYARAELLNE